MTLSGPFIDQDMNYVDIQTAYHLTELVLYKTTDLQTNPPITGAIVLAYSTFAELTDVKFCRVRARGNYVYVMGMVNIGAADADIVVFYSSDSGTTWRYTLVAQDVPIDFKTYKVTYNNSTLGSLGAGTGVSYDTHVRWGDSINTKNPWAIVLRHYTTRTDHPGWDGFAATGAADVIHPTGAASGEDPDGTHYYAMVNNYLTIPEKVIADGYVTDYLGAHDGGITVTSNMPLDAARIKVAHACVGPSDPWFNESWVFWNIPDPIKPTAFDIGKHNPLKVYVGTKDRIYRSNDGAAHFEEYLAYGANDIECHLAQSASDDEITFWSDDGFLVRTVGGAVGGVYGGVADVSPIAVPFRITSDPINGFPIFVLEHQGSEVYKLRKSVDGVAWSDLTVDGSTSLTKARSLKEYAIVTTLQRRIIVLKSNGIFYSTDESTFTNKTGNFTGFAPGYAGNGASPVVANLW
jgi:hypothetical protein